MRPEDWLAVVTIVTESPAIAAAVREHDAHIRERVRARKLVVVVIEKRR